MESFARLATVTAERARPYHHGSLRAEVIAAAVAEVEAVGAAAVSLRKIARRAGVSHAAPVHHFGDKTGLFTAIAAEGFRLATEAIAPAAMGRYGFLDGGAAYVIFALRHPGYFEVMFRPGLHRADDPELIEAREAAFDVLQSSGARLAEEWDIDDVSGLVLTGWSMVHGLATLYLAGNLDDHVCGTDLDTITGHLYSGLSALGRVAEHRTEEP